jgi:hypothetical protein
MSICRRSVGWRFKRLLTLSPFSEGVMLHFRLAELTGLEPATSAVTGQRSNQLSYNSRFREREARTDSHGLQLKNIELNFLQVSVLVITSG